MISVDHLRLMARYNTWQNASLYAAADTLDDAARRQERGAFWGSIHGTLNHILWADHIWMSRFSDWPKPAVAQKQSPTFASDWSDLKLQRHEADRRIEAWTRGLNPTELEGDLVWFSGALGREATAPRWVCLTHFFDHQTHHRGQIHAQLTAVGAKPDDTDLFFLPVATP